MHDLQIGPPGPPGPAPDPIGPVSLILLLYKLTDQHSIEDLCA